MKHCLLAIVAVLALGCGAPKESANAEPPSPKFIDVVMTDNETTKEPRTTFTNETPKLFVFFGFKDVPMGSKLKGVWTCEKAPNIPADFKIDEATVEVGPLTNSGTFSLSKPNGGWPFGSYRVDLYLGDRVLETVKFEVAPAEGG